MTAWLLDKLWVKNRIREHVGIPARSDPLRPSTTTPTPPARSSARRSSEAAILTVDGVGEWTTTALGVGEGNDLPAHRRDAVPAFARPAVFGVHGVPRVRGQRRRIQGHGNGAVWHSALRRQGVAGWSTQASDGSFALDLDYFAFHHSTRRTFSERFVSLVRRAPAAPVLHRARIPVYFGEAGTSSWRRNQHTLTSPPASSASPKRLVLGLARAAHVRTGSTALCMAGGVALNSVANGRILRETPIREILHSAGCRRRRRGARRGAVRGAPLLGSRGALRMDHAYWGAIAQRRRRGGCGRQHDAAACRTIRTRVR